MNVMNERYYFIDWLRIIAIILVLFFHVGMIFCSEWGWHIKNNQTSNIILEFNFWLSRFRMPLLFFISGAGAYWALRKRTAGRFMKERNNRLIIPLIFSMLVIVPPQVFFERLFTGAFSGSFLEFYPTISNGPYPEGNGSWHHMWFVLYLFIYSAVLLPVFLVLRKKAVQNWLQKIKWLNSLFGVFCLVSTTVLLYVFWTVKYPRTNDLISDWGYLPYWMTFFFVGYFMSLNSNYWNIIEDNRKLLLKMALLLIVFQNYLRWNNLTPMDIYGDEWAQHSISKLYLIFRPANAWLWLLAAVGYGKKYLNKNHKVLAYANRGIYPFYILHQTLIVVIGYYVVNLQESIFLKYLFVAIVSFVLTVAIYDFLIRPFRVTRFLFGVKELKKKKQLVVKKHDSKNIIIEQKELVN